MIFLTWRFDRYAKTIMHSVMQSRVLCELRHTSRYVALQDSIRSLKKNILHQTLAFERYTRTITGWFASLLPWTKGFQLRSNLSASFSSYDTLLETLSRSVKKIQRPSTASVALTTLCVKGNVGNGVSDHFFLKRTYHNALRRDAVWERAHRHCSVQPLDEKQSTPLDASTHRPTVVF